MISSKEIVDLEKKYSKLTLKKRVKLSIYIFFIFLIVFFVIYYFFYINTIKIQKKITDADKVQTINTLISKTDTNKTFKKNIVKPKITKKIYNNNNKTKGIEADTKSKLPTKQEPTKQEPTKQEPTKQEPTKQKESKNRNNTSFCFKLVPNEKNSSNQAPSKRLIFGFALNQKNKTETAKVKPKTVKNRNKDGTITSSNSSKPKIDIEMRDIDSIQYLKDKFKKTNDIAFALMLCENYYSQKDYKNSLKWSIIANDIDSDSERSWIWFAKSKYRLNQKDDAIKALKSFLKRDDSAYIKSLLRQIINGEMND